MIPKFDKAVRAISRGETGFTHPQPVPPELVDWEPLDENGIRVCAEPFRMRKRYAEEKKREQEGGAG